MKTNEHRPLPPIWYLKSRLWLDHKTGVLYWKPRPACQFSAPYYALTWNAKHAEKPAGGAKGRGYVMVRIDGIAYQAHRVAFAIANGVDPGGAHVDHKTGKANSPRNLQLATNQENVRKRMQLGKNNTSGILGVSWSKAARKWTARIKIGGQGVYLGVFTDIKDAARARRKAEKQHFGRFAPRIEHGVMDATMKRRGTE